MSSFKEDLVDFLQEKLGNTGEMLVDDLKFVIKFQLALKVTPKGIRLFAEPLPGNSTPFIAIVDQSTGKDIFKIQIPVDAEFPIADTLKDVKEKIIEMVNTIKFPVDTVVPLAKGTNKQ